MATEIERKFLVEGDSWREEVVRSQQMVQGYLSPEGERNAVRVRIKGGDQARLTIKGPTEGIARAEFEYTIPLEDAQDMLKLRKGALIEKTRYIVERGALIWEIDVFEGDNEGLVVAEVELEGEQVEVELPGWVGEEVSDDPRYYNANLVWSPYTDWET